MASLFQEKEQAERRAEEALKEAEMKADEALKEVNAKLNEVSQ